MHTLFRGLILAAVGLCLAAPAFAAEPNLPQRPGLAERPTSMAERKLFSFPVIPAMAMPSMRDTPGACCWPSV